MQGEKKREEKAARGHQGPTANKLMSHTAAFLTSNQVTLVMSMAAQVWHELRNVLMVMILLMLYLVLWVPYIVMVKYDQVHLLHFHRTTFLELSFPNTRAKCSFSTNCDSFTTHDDR